MAAGVAGQRALAMVAAMHRDDCLEMERLAREMADGCVLPESRQAVLELADRYHDASKLEPRATGCRPLVVLIISLLLFALYLPIALILGAQYVPPKRPASGTVYSLTTQPHKVLENKPIYSSRLPPAVAGRVDTALIYEDDKPLPYPRSYSRDAIDLGYGRYFFEDGFVHFSTTDNTDPNTNGRAYWLVLPAKD
jgi:hypothetical protein